MRRIEALGAELAMAIRREADMRAALLAAESRLDEATRERVELEKCILTASTNDLYVDTGSFPAVPDNRETQVIQDVPCPGDVCAWYRGGRRHAHTPDGEIWDLEFRQTS